MKQTLPDGNCLLSDNMLKLESGSHWGKCVDAKVKSQSGTGVWEKSWIWFNSFLQQNMTSLSKVVYWSITWMHYYIMLLLTLSWTKDKTGAMVITELCVWVLESTVLCFAPNTLKPFKPVPLTWLLKFEYYIVSLVYEMTRRHMPPLPC